MELLKESRIKSKSVNIWRDIDDRVLQHHANHCRIISLLNIRFRISIVLECPLYPTTKNYFYHFTGNCWNIYVWIIIGSLALKATHCKTCGKSFEEAGRYQTYAQCTQCGRDRAKNYSSMRYKDPKKKFLRRKNKFCSRCGKGLVGNQITYCDICGQHTTRNKESKGPALTDVPYKTLDLMVMCHVCYTDHTYFDVPPDKPPRCKHCDSTDVRIIGYADLEGMV